MPSPACRLPTPGFSSARRPAPKTSHPAYVCSSGAHSPGTTQLSLAGRDVVTYGDLTVAQRVGYATELNGHEDAMPDHRLTEETHDHDQLAPPRERRSGHLDQKLRPRPPRGQHLGLSPQRAHGLRP